jgi:hypothetical protein
MQAYAFLLAGWKHFTFNFLPLAIARSTGHGALLTALLPDNGTQSADKLCRITNYQVAIKKLPCP